MDLYVLGDHFNKDELIDEYASVIWTERYTDSGDVTLVVEDTAANRALLSGGPYMGSVDSDPVFLGIDDSDEVMLIETLDISGGSIKATGATLDKFLNNRIVIPENDLEQASLTVTMYPGFAMCSLVERYAKAGQWMDTTNPLGIDGTPEAFTGLTTLPTYIGAIETFTIARGPLFDAIKQLGQNAKIGWSFFPTNISAGGHDLQFKSYKGLDRRSTQLTNAMVRFSSRDDSLAEVKEVRSVDGYKTVAYAISPGFDAADQLVGGSQYTGVAYAYPGADTEVDFRRRTLLVEITGVTAEAVNDSFSEYQAVMNRHAKNALANNNFTRVIDGEVIPNEYTFGTDYSMGDIVELEDHHVYIQPARVTEYIRSNDSNGFNAYPTVEVLDPSDT